MNALLNKLSHAEVETIKLALEAAVEGRFFDDAEFQTIMGVTRAEMRQLQAAWPHRTVSTEVFRLSIFNSINNLLDYPHHREVELAAYFPNGTSVIEDVRKQLRRLI